MRACFRLLEEKQEEVEALLDERDLIIRTQQVQLAERSANSGKHAGSDPASPSRRGKGVHASGGGAGSEDGEAILHLREMVQLKTEVR